MDEAEKCTDLAYISLGKLLYSGTTKNLLPFSNVKTYLVVSKKQSEDQLTEEITKAYPELLLSVVNNDLRASSANQELLTKFYHDQNNYSLTEVTPSFEEVFIGLMK